MYSQERMVLIVATSNIKRPPQARAFSLFLTNLPMQQVQDRSLELAPNLTLQQAEHALLRSIRLRQHRCCRLAHDLRFGQIASHFSKVGIFNA